MPSVDAPSRVSAKLALIPEPSEQSSMSTTTVVAQEVAVIQRCVRKTVTVSTALAGATAISNHFESWLRKTCAAIIEQRIQVAAANTGYHAILN